MYQAYRTSPQSSREPSEQTSTQAQTIVSRLLQPGNTDTRSVRPTKGQKCVDHVLMCKIATPEGINKRYSGTSVVGFFNMFCASHQHKRTQLNTRTSMRSADATNLRVAFFIP